MSHSYIIFSFLLLNLFLFKFFAAIISGIVLFISFLDCSLLISRNKIIFCTEILCPIANKCCTHLSALVNVLCFEIWFYVFIISISFILISVSFLCLNFPDQNEHSVVNRRGKGTYPGLSLISEENTQPFLTKSDVSCGFWQTPYIKLRKCLLFL